MYKKRAVERTPLRIDKKPAASTTRVKKKAKLSEGALEEKAKKERQTRIATRRGRRKCVK